MAIFIRCFADKKGIEGELERKLYLEFPRGLLATISVIFCYCFRSFLDVSLLPFQMKVPFLISFKL